MTGSAEVLPVLVLVARTRSPSLMAAIGIAALLAKEHLGARGEARPAAGGRDPLGYLCCVFWGRATELVLFLIRRNNYIGCYGNRIECFRHKDYALPRCRIQNPHQTEDLFQITR